MASVINTNIASLSTQRHLSNSRSEMEQSMERMSSGKRINSSMDDAAGLAIGNRMTSQIEGLNQAVRNANDGISLAQTAESALDGHSNLLQRMRVLAVQAANDTYSAADRRTLNNEIVQLKEELNRSVGQAIFNGQKILDGSNTSFTFQTGHAATDTVTVALTDMSGSKIGTKVWSNKYATTPPVTVPVVTPRTAVGTIAGTATGSTPINGASSGSVKSKINLIVQAAAAVGDKMSVTIGTTTYEHTFVTARADATAAALAFRNAFDGDSTAGAAYDATVAGAVITFETPTVVDGQAAPVASAIYTPVPITAEQESYDYSGITLAEGDRVSLTVTGSAAITAVPEIDTYLLANAVTSATTGLSFTFGGITKTQAYASSPAGTLTALVAQIDSITGITAAVKTSVASGTTSFTIVNDVGNNTQMIKGTISGDYNGSAAASFTSVLDTRVGVAAVAEGADKTYIQEFVTDQATTLNALGALVVQGDSGYTSKVLTSGKLVFTGAADGSAMSAATAKIETAAVSAANSVDDIIITDTTSAKAALTVLDGALEMMAEFRSRMGAASNRMFHTINNLMAVSENTSASRSRIVDADYAAESASLAKSQVLQQAGTAMLAQANASTQDILSLLK